MDFELTKTQKDIQKAVRDFCKGEFDKELALELEEKHEFPKKIWQKAGELGLIGVHFPEEYSGQGLGCMEAILVVEELCRNDSTIGSAIALSAFASEIILHYGSEEQKKKYLPEVAEARMLSAGAFTEPDHGSDITFMNTTAVKDGDHWVINGGKTFITNGGLAGFYSVLCQTDPDAKPGYRGQSLILVEADRPGVSTTDVGRKMGIRMMATAEVIFKDVRVPLSNLIGEENKGFYQVLNFFDESRIQIAAQALGTAQGAYDRALAYVKQREQFGKKIAQFQATQHKLADMATKIELARLITYKAAWNYDQGRIDPKLTSMAKMFAARTAVEVADEAIQLLGGYGYMTEYEVERFYRDAKITEIYEGKREIKKNPTPNDLVGKWRYSGRYWSGGPFRTGSDGRTRQAQVTRGETAMSNEVQIYRPKNHVRVVTATSLFDGHDASINIFRRILQGTGVEVIHLGHNRSVQEIVDAAIEEDVQGIAVSSYQGGHMEFFKYMVDLLKEADARHIKIFGGGGGVIVPEEIKELEQYGVTKIYSPEDGARMGLQGIINHMVQTMDFPRITDFNYDLKQLSPDNKKLVANLITAVEYAKALENGHLAKLRAELKKKLAGRKVPVIGITGTGGSGKSSLTDELIQRMLHDLKDVKVAIISADPSRRKTGGALLGDRIRMNAIGDPRVYMRSLATRRSHSEIPESLADAIEVAKAAGFDLVIAETAGIGQGDSHIIDLVDISMYVMTADFGAASQLEKIDMLDFADLVVVNKFEKRGGEDAVRDVRKQVQRNRNAFDKRPEDMPVYGTIASKFNDDGVTALYHGLLDAIKEKCGVEFKSSLPRPEGKVSTSKTIIIPPERTRYLAEIAETIRSYHAHTERQAEALRRVWHLEETARHLEGADLEGDKETLLERLRQEAEKARQVLDSETRELVEGWPEIRKRYQQDELVYQVRGREIRVPLFTESLARKKIPKISLPRFEDPGEIYRWLRRENLPGYFPYTAGVFPLKRVGEDPTRMFAGEGDPARTNRRFKLLSANSPAKRLSTAFDSVTLYGYDPDRRPDIYGKVGNSGVSVCTLDDVKVLYSGFDLCAPTTSVSMTINGPAPIMLAMFLNTAIDQEVDKFKAEKGREPTKEEYENIKARALSTVRGTVQADILKEDQGQNTCIFSIDFALKMMGDIQEYFIKNNVRNFYSVSISGYHIAEAGANPISQLAFTLANGFTYLEYYLSRGMDIDAFGPNFSFFFSNGMDPEYTVIGRVARRIWAIALREKYGASKRSQMLKYHIQTSGRSLHSQDIQFNDIRTTLQALCAIYDNCQSLHTNAFDEAITTPTEESVRRALAIQLIINREWGLAKNENPLQGSFIVEELTDLVEEAVLMEFDRITERGGVLGAMETGYQRGKIQEESIYYETLKHTGELPIIGVNTFRDPHADGEDLTEGGPCIDLARATEEEKESQLRRLAEFQARNADKAPQALERLQKVVLSGGNIFAELMETVRCCSLGQITEALYAVGGQYRRNM